MVATDVAARGIDVEGISHVINYDIPTYAEDYIHRIGRTGRALSTGDALTFVTRSEARHVKKIEQFIGKKFEIKKYPDFDYNKVEEKPVKQAHQPDGEHKTDDEQNFNREPRGESRDRFKRDDRRTSSRPRSGGSSDRREGFKRDDRRGGDRFRSGGDSRKREFPKSDSFGGERKTFSSEERKPFGGERKSFSNEERKPFGEERGNRDFSKRKPFSNTGSDRNFKKRESFGGERGFVKRDSFGGGRRDGGSAKRTPFSGDRKEGGYGKRDIFGPKKHDSFGGQKREHTFKKQESFSEAGSYSGPKPYGSPRPHSGPDWKQLIPEEREYKPREHKVVKKMVSRKKKD